VYTTSNDVVQEKYKGFKELSTLSTSVNKTIKDLRLKNLKPITLRV
jgi:hypothetical protein